MIHISPILYFQVVPNSKFPFLIPFQSCVPSYFGFTPASGLRARGISNCLIDAPESSPESSEGPPPPPPGGEPPAESQIHGDTIEMREVAARLCRDYLHGAWKKVTAQSIGFKHIR
ncbi:hypothetical protein YQE_01833, partial [Dendroctonus ponderosae]